MSLIVYCDDTPRDPNFSVILNDPYRNAIVLYNKSTNELSVLKTVSNVSITGAGIGPGTSNDQELVPYDSRKGIVDVTMKKCPHCGRSYKDQTLKQIEPIEDQLDEMPDTSESAANETSPTVSSEPFIDTNYFKLLSDSATSSGHALPDSLFTQGYFEKFFKEIELLGRGARGSVYKVEHSLNGISLGHFALKKITIGDDSKCNLVNYNHVWLEVASINDFGPKIPCAFILQQYCSGGNLEDFVLNLKTPKLSASKLKKWRLHNKHKTLEGRSLNNDEILLIFSQIVSGVDELHKNHIIHRDLKPSNCLLSQPYFQDFTKTEPDLSKMPTILVSDFGESQIEGEIRNATGATGTLEYTAPEIFNIQKGSRVQQFNKKTDIYSLGMILYFICFGKLPYESTDFDILQSEIKSFNPIDMSLDLRDDLLLEFQTLIRNLTSKDPEERMSADEILDYLRKIGSIDHYVSQQDPENLPFVKRLSLTDGIEKPTVLKNLIREKQKVMLTIINLLALKIICQYQFLGYISIFAIGFTITQDIKQVYILTISMAITSIILIIYNYSIT